MVPSGYGMLQIITNKYHGRRMWRISLCTTLFKNIWKITLEFQTQQNAHHFRRHTYVGMMQHNKLLRCTAVFSNLWLFSKTTDKRRDLSVWWCDEPKAISWHFSWKLKHCFLQNWLTIIIEFCNALYTCYNLVLLFQPLFVAILLQPASPTCMFPRARCLRNCRSDK